MSKKVIFIAMLLFLLIGCADKSKPMSILESNELIDDPEYNLDFWKNEAKNNTALWRRADSYCTKMLSSKPHKPNCDQIVLFWEKDDRSKN